METSRKPRNIKVHNEKLLIRILGEEEALSASEIAAKANLSITSVMKILDSLQSSNAVKSIGKGASTDEGGKRPELFAVNEEYMYSVGCTFYYTSIMLCLMDFRHNIVDTQYVKCEKNEATDGEQAIKTIAESVRAFVQQNHIAPEKICGVAVGLNGIIDADKGIVRHAIPDVGWVRNVHAGEFLNELLPEFQNIRVDNNGRYGAYATYLAHPDYKTKAVFYVSVGEHTVGCLLANGELQRGFNGFLGEVGHMTILPDFKAHRCTCGSYGCFESLVSEESVMELAEVVGKNSYPDSELYKDIAAKKSGFKELFAAANGGDEYAGVVVARVAKYFSLLVRNIMLCCDPELIVFSGVYEASGESFQNALMKEISEIPFFDIGARAKVKFLPSNSTNSGAVGAALYAIDRYLRHTDMI